MALNSCLREMIQELKNEHSSTSEKQLKESEVTETTDQTQNNIISAVTFELKRLIHN